jgi:hypothetical protein
MEFLSKVPQNNLQYQQSKELKGIVPESNEQYQQSKLNSWLDKVPVNEGSNQAHMLLEDWAQMLEFQKDFPFPTLESIFEGKGAYIETVYTQLILSKMLVSEKAAYPLDPFNRNFPASPNIIKRHAVGTLFYTKMMSRFNNSLFSESVLNQAVAEIWMETAKFVDCVDLIRIGIGEQMPNGLNIGILVAFVDDNLWDDYFAGGLNINNDKFILIKRSYLRDLDILREFLAHEIMHVIQGFRNRTYRQDLLEFNSQEECFYYSIISEMESYIVGGYSLLQENSLDFNKFLQCFIYTPYSEFVLLDNQLQEKLRKVYANCQFILTKTSQAEKIEFIAMINHQKLTLDDLANKYKIQMETGIFFTNN